MTVRIVRLGAPREPGEGLRIGTVRRPPRGVAKADFARKDYYDVWLPNLSPSAALVSQALAAATPAQWNTFARRFRAEMNDAACARLLDVFAALSHGADFAMGCYCADENRCHRAILRALLAERGARIA